MNNVKFYTEISAMEPLFPDGNLGKLQDLALRVVTEASKLDGMLHPNTIKALFELCAPMNTYYTNLIEGHNTHPLDIDKALKNKFDNELKNRNLQLEAKAHYNVLKNLLSTPIKTPYSEALIKDLHKEFYDHLPIRFRNIELKGGEIKELIPGKYRNMEVEVGNHVAPLSKTVESFMIRFCAFYESKHKLNSQMERLIAIAAAHHRLVWIHPFLDGNGRVARLFTDACLINENLHCNGLWSVSRGFARSIETYRARLSNADLSRYNDYDGRGNLSEKFLVEFIEYFLETCIDQICFMRNALQLDKIIERISGFLDLMVIRNKAKSFTKHIIIDVFTKGKITKNDAMRITGTSDKTLKKEIDRLIEFDFIEAKKVGVEMTYFPKFPIAFSPIIFPNMYPSDKEIDLTNSLLA